MFHYIYSFEYNETKTRNLFISVHKTRLRYDVVVDFYSYYCYYIMLVACGLFVTARTKAPRVNRCFFRRIIDPFVDDTLYETFSAH